MSPRTTSRPAIRFFSPDAHDERARARQVAQRVQRPLGLPLLVEGDADDDEDEAEEHERLLHVAEDEVERAAGDAGGGTSAP